MKLRTSRSLKLKRVRKSGCTCPWERRQFLTYLFFFFEAGTCYGLTMTQLQSPILNICYYGLALFFLIFTWLGQTVDPTDPLVALQHNGGAFTPQDSHLHCDICDCFV